MRRRALAVCLLIVFTLGTNPAFAASAKVGGPCTKVGVKSGSLICAKVSGKLKWQILKKAQTIKYSAPKQGSISDKTLTFTFSSTSKLAVRANAITPNICRVGKSVILVSGVSGICRVSLEQKGNTYFLAAKKVLIEFNIFGTNVIAFQLPSALLLSTGTFQMSATSNSNLPVTLVSNTPAICTVAEVLLTLLQSGTCTVVASQVGADLIPPAYPVTQTIEISATRAMGDLPDTVTGFQVKPVYVVPSDGTDNFYDTNGYLAGILDEGNSYLNGQIGQTVPVDRTANGYDIQYLHSQYSSSYLQSHADAPEATSDGYLLLSEMKAMENPGSNRKDYIFFIDVPGFGGSFCGMADRPGMIAVVALQNISNSDTCRGPSAPFFDNYTSKTWVHEMIHNFGVGHTLDDPCDLMAGKPETPGTCTSSVRWTMDKERTRYVGASAQGQDILKLRVWKGYTDDQGLQADCILDPVLRQDGVPYAYCPTGTQAIGALTYCWSSINSVSLEENVNGVWISLGSGNYFNQPWGSRISWKCNDPNYDAPWKELTVDTAGIRHYRWVINGQPKEELNVIWVN